MNKDDGILSIAEFYYSKDNPGSEFYKYSLGGWFYSSEFEEIKNPLESGRENSGFYAFAERQLYFENTVDSQGLAAFTRLGFANSSYNQLESYFGIGTVYTGLIPGRDEDLIGLALAKANNGQDYIDSIKNSGGEVDNSEINLELVYDTGILPWLRLQFDMQYVINPGTNPDLKNALALGMRFAIDF